MLPHEYARLKGFMKASKLDRQHRRAIASKRSAKGRAKHVNVPLKNSRIYMPSPDKLFSSVVKYKSLNPDSNLAHQAT